MDDAHERPVNVAGLDVIGLTGDGEMANDLIGTDEIDADISSAGVVHVHGDGDVLDARKVGLLEQVWGDIEADRYACLSLGDGFVDGHEGREEPGLGLDVLPGPGGLDDGEGVELAVGEGVTVLVADTRVLPVPSVQVDGYGGVYDKILHVPPGQVRADVKHEGKDADGEGGSC